MNTKQIIPVIIIASAIAAIWLLSGSSASTTASHISEIYTPGTEEKAAWERLRAEGIDRLAFVKRYTYNSNHYYTEYLNSSWMPGGNICTIDLNSGEVRELAPSLSNGVFGAFDVSYDAKRIVFAWKASKDMGYRLYEVNTDGSNLHQLTFSPENEDETVNTYRVNGYSHATEDLDPCYLPDGGIAFVSTRCHFGILCDGPDEFTTTVLYRMDGDGRNMRQLSNSSVSENTPTILPDGRILYTRWEYVDKGAVAVKCLWAMNPDGSNSSEIYGDDIQAPTTMIMARAIPGTSGEYVFTGTPHCCPQNGVGTVIRVDASKDIRSSSAMTYITPDIQVRYEIGIAYRDKKDTTRWYQDNLGQGELFRETYPLSRTDFIVSHKQAGKRWDDRKGYDLYILKEGGAVQPVYSDTSISCFRPIPVVKRNVPPVIPSTTNAELAASNRAECIVTDIYEGMTDVNRGDVKFLRVMEQVPRPWGARRHYGQNVDEYDQQHVVISKDTHLGLKIQHGIVTVEEDGSAHFLVPAGRNIFLQALDADCRAIQTERTYVNYMPGEVRSCTGCHETSSQAPNKRSSSPMALKRKAEIPFAQPGEVSGQKTLSYARDVQPVWDRHCIQCHNRDKAAGGLNLSGRETRLFNESYEALLPERRKLGGGRIHDIPREQLALAGNESYIDSTGTYFSLQMPDNSKHTTEGLGFYVNSNGQGYTKQFDRGLLGAIIGENHPKNGNIRYLPAKSLGSYTSVLVAMLCPDIKLENKEAQQRAEHLAKVHRNISVPPSDILRITNWIDTNCQYYGSYYGRRDSSFKNHPDYRKEYDIVTAVSPNPPASYYQ
jgi:hypothetical protein